MTVSVIICTYGRAASLVDVLDCLAGQTFRDLEVLLVDGNEADSAPRAAIRDLVAEAEPRLPIRLIQSRRGLTSQRNAGLREARGELVCFFDDDVTFDAGFFAQAVDLFRRPGMEDVGGATGYD